MGLLFGRKRRKRRQKRAKDKAKAKAEKALADAKSKAAKARENFAKRADAAKNNLSNSIKRASAMAAMRNLDAPGKSKLPMLGAGVIGASIFANALEGISQNLADGLSNFSLNAGKPLVYSPGYSPSYNKAYGDIAWAPPSIFGRQGPPTGSQPSQGLALDLSSYTW
jgi:hypothetical protein